MRSSAAGGEASGGNQVTEQSQQREVFILETNGVQGLSALRFHDSAASGSSHISAAGGEAAEVCKQNTNVAQRRCASKTQNDTMLSFLHRLVHEEGNMC